MTHIKYPLPCLLYDDECTLCTRFKQSLERLDGEKQFTMVSIHNNEIYEIYPELEKEKCSETIHLIDNEEKIHKGSNAINYLIAKIPEVSKFAWLAQTGMGKKAIDFFYSMANKYREGLKNDCPTCKKKHA